MSTVKRDQWLAGAAAWAFSAGLLVLGCGSSSTAAPTSEAKGGSGNGLAAAGASGSSAVGAGGTLSGGSGSSGAGPSSAGAFPGSAGLGSGGTGTAGAAASAGSVGQSAGSGGRLQSAGGAGNASGGGAAGGANTDPNQRRLLLRDEGNSAVHYVDLGRAANNWSVVVPTGRELQLIGNRRFLIGTDSGYDSRSVTSQLSAGNLDLGMIYGGAWMTPESVRRQSLMKCKRSSSATAD